MQGCGVIGDGMISEGCAVNVVGGKQGGEMIFLYIAGNFDAMESWKK